MPRKSDASRRSDVSMARFVPVDGAAEKAAGPSKPETPVKAAPEATDMETDDAPATAAESTPVGDKDKRDAREGKEGGAVAIEDLNLPRSIVMRLAKGVLPPNTQIQQSAVLAMTKSATVFVNFLANAANELTTAAGKKTIMPQDVFDALEDVEFPQFKEMLEAEFKKFNTIQTTKRNTYRRKVAAAKKGIAFQDGQSQDPNASMMSTASTDSAANHADVSSLSATGVPHRSKKQKPNENSTMDVDNDDEDAPDPDPEDEPEEDEDDEDEQEEGEEEEEEQEDDEEDEEEMQDALEEKSDNGEEEDEALDHESDDDDDD